MYLQLLMAVTQILNNVASSEIKCKLYKAGAFDDSYFCNQQHSSIRHVEYTPFT